MYLIKGLFIEQIVQDAGKLLMDIEARIGELSKAIPQLRRGGEAVRERNH